jgi:hypothetical protein
MTPGRKYALIWFADHDKDATSVLLRRAPSTKMHRLMRREGQLTEHWHLTPAGRADYEQAQTRQRPAKKPRARRAPRLPRQAESQGR